MKNLKKTLISKKAAKYSLLASAAISMLASCGKDEPENNDPNIDETDINPDISLTPALNATDSVDLDINGDGIMDISVGVYNYNYSYGGVTSDVNAGTLTGLSGAEVLTVREDFTVGGYDYYGDFAVALSEGNTISSAQSVWLDEAYLSGNGVIQNNPTQLGQFLGQDKFVGVRIQAVGNTHYAWIRMSMSEDGTNVMVKEYAYNITPDAAITAGAK